MLDNLDEFDAETRTLPTLARPDGPWTELSPETPLHCSTCGDARRMKAQRLFRANATRLVRLCCVQCDGVFIALRYAGPQGPSLAIFSEALGGLSTPNTPKPVAFYLDQAHRAHSVGAHSAAVAMYRAALEHLLHQQGYTQGMLGAKVSKLESDLATSIGPKWTRDLDPEFLTVLKDLGNGSIHANDGSVERQAVLDTEIVNRVKVTFVHLLFLVYEAESRRAEHLSKLRAAALALKK